LVESRIQLLPVKDAINRLPVAEKIRQQLWDMRLPEVKNNLTILTPGQGHRREYFENHHVVNVPVAGSKNLTGSASGEFSICNAERLNVGGFSFNRNRD
jgi:hypothetical protein